MRGSITSINIDEVKAGAYLDLDISYRVEDSGASWTDPIKVFLVARDSLGNAELVKDADVRSDPFTDSGSWRLWKMPNQAIALEVRLFGHDEIVPWNWSWW